MGVAAALVASGISSFAICYQAKALKYPAEVDASAHRMVQLFQRYQWHLAFSVYLIASAAGSVVALSFIPPVVLAPLHSFGLVYNIFASNLLLETKITRKDWIATLLIMSGCALVSAFGAFVPDDNLKIGDLIRLFTRPVFIIYFSLQLGLLVSVTVWAILESKKLKKLLVSSEYPPLMDDSSDDLEEHSRLVANTRHEPIGLVFAIVSGVVGSLAMILAKSGIGLLIISIIDSNNQFHGMFSFVLLFLILFLAVWQLFALNMALFHTETTLVVPLAYTFHSCFSLINSLIYLDQVTGVYSAGQYALLLAGVSVIISGVWLLKSRH